VKLDALYGQFALFARLPRRPARRERPSLRPRDERVTENGTPNHRAPKFLAELAQHAQPAAQRIAAVGSLESTLTTLTIWWRRRITDGESSHAAVESGSHALPGNGEDVAIQLIRNAVVHGVGNRSAERETAGKSANATLRLEFNAVRGKRLELSFQDDWAGTGSGQGPRALPVARES